MGEGGSAPKSPKLVKRREHKNSNFRAGRTIGEKREKLETANERALARKKDKQKKATRVVATVLGFGVLAAILVVLAMFFSDSEKIEFLQPGTEKSYEPTIQIIDEDAASGGQITSRMREHIGLVEADLKDLGIIPTKAVVPSGSIRQVDFYLDGYKGYVKMTIDRESAVSAEDTERMLRYLRENGVGDFEYIDVRVDGRAFWK